MKKIKTQKVSFKTWEEYDNILNAMYEDGWRADETIERHEFTQLGIKEHLIRFLKV